MAHDHSRREFLKYLLTGAGVAAASSTISIPSHGLDVSSIASLLSMDPLTLEYKVLGPCCKICFTHRIVNHFRPIYIIEAIRGPGDSVFSGELNKATTKLNLNAYVDDQKNFAIRVWDVPGWSVDIATGNQGCRLCSDHYAPKAVSSMGSSLSPLLESMCSSDALLGEILGEINEALPLCMPKLLYDTNFDPGWRNGCHDLTKIAEKTAGMGCTTLGPGISSLAGGVFGNNPCIGNWGAMYPRQMALKSPDPRMSAAIASMRAMNLATERGFLNFETSPLIGKLQITNPQPRPGFLAGTTPSRLSIQSSPASKNGTYAFVWWLPVSCCKSLTDIKGLCVPAVSCFTGG